MTGGDTPPVQPEGAKVDPSPEKLGAMNASAEKSGSPAEKGKLPCEQVKSWFAFRVAHEADNKIVEGLTLKLKIPDFGDMERVTSKAVDPVKIDLLAPGGKGDVKSIECGDEVWEAVGDITST